MSRPTGVVGLLLAVVVSGAVLAVARADTGVSVQAAPAPTGATNGCAAPTGATAPDSVVPGATTVTFTLPARTFVRVDDAGSPVAAMTNTLCPPAVGDEVVVVDRTGAVVTGMSVRPAGLPWSGDWSRAGSWHAWPAG